MLIGLLRFSFLTELIIRFIGEENKKYFFKNPWNIFDTVIVTLSLIPLDNSDTSKVARLVRVFRVMRLVSMIPELRVLLNSLFRAMVPLTYVALLMFIIFYIYAAIGSILFYEVNAELWGNISIALLTLFRIMTFEDWTDVMYETLEFHPWSWIYYLTFIFLYCLCFLKHGYWYCCECV